MLEVETAVSVDRVTTGALFVEVAVPLLRVLPGPWSNVAGFCAALWSACLAAVALGVGSAAAVQANIADIAVARITLGVCTFVFMYFLLI